MSTILSVLLHSHSNRKRVSFHLPHIVRLSDSYAVLCIDMPQRKRAEGGKANVYAAKTNLNILLEDTVTIEISLYLKKGLNSS